MLRSICVPALVYIALPVLGYAQSPVLPEGKGKAEFKRICGDCHDIAIVTKLRLNADRWTGLVDDMVSRGAQGTQDEFDRISKYLAANFAPKAARPAAARETK